MMPDFNKQMGYSKIAIRYFILSFLIFIYCTVAYAQKDLSHLVKKVSPSVVAINVFDEAAKLACIGTGFFIKEDGTLVTNYHVIKCGIRVEAKLSNGIIFPIGKILSEDIENDLVLLTLEAKGKFPHLKIADTQIEVGQPVVVIGSPFGLEGTVSDGIISAIRDLPGWGEILQITAPISKGSSGSPVVNMKGEVIGVASFQFIAGQNLNFAIPAEKVASLFVTKDKAKVQKYQPPAPQVPSADPMQVASKIQALKDLLKKEPRNLSALVELGNLYFDIDQPREAIEAYSKYLAIGPDNPDVRSDMGIMYRKLGDFDRAIQEFRRAAQSNPKHINSWYNLGIVLLHDKQDIKGAIKAFEEYLRVESKGERAEKIKDQLEKLRKLSR